MSRTWSAWRIAFLNSCAPFPTVGADPNEDHPGAIGCVAYGGETPVSDGNSSVSVESAMADADGAVTITLRVTSSRPVADLAGTLLIESDVLANGTGIDDAKIGRDEGFFFQDTSVIGEQLQFGFLPIIGQPIATRDGWLVSLSACLDQGVSAGTYAITLDAVEIVDFNTFESIDPLAVGGNLTVAPQNPGAGCAAGADPDQSNEHRFDCLLPEREDPPVDPFPEDQGLELDFLRGDINADGNVSLSDGVMSLRLLFVSATVPDCKDAHDIDDSGTSDISDFLHLASQMLSLNLGLASPFPEVGPDPTPDGAQPNGLEFLSCNEYNPVMPEQTTNIVEIGTAEGAPGQLVEIPVFLTNDRAVEAYQLVIRYDPDVLEVFPGFGVGLTFNNSFYRDSLPEEDSLLPTLIYRQPGYRAWLPRGRVHSGSSAGKRHPTRNGTARVQHPGAHSRHRHHRHSGTRRRERANRRRRRSIWPQERGHLSWRSAIPQRFPRRHQR
jgi:hypothetical protein